MISSTLFSTNYFQKTIRNHNKIRNGLLSDVLDVTMLDEESLRWDAIDVDLEIDSIIHPECYPISF